MDVRRLDEIQAQGRSIFDTELAVAYYARVSTDKDEQIKMCIRDRAKALLNGAPDGPSAWDGYVACVTGDALILSRQTGKPEAIELMEKPSIY